MTPLAVLRNPAGAIAKDASIARDMLHIRAVKRIESLLQQLTTAEKVAMCAGSGMWHSTGVPRLGIPPIKVTDGPNGARGESRGGLSAACFPVGSALAATWNPRLIEQVGRALGQEAKSKGAQVLLGPTVNLHRSPLGGRHFEGYSEDPHLTSRIAVAFVRGVQAEGVGACIKHYICNESEFERMTISSEVSQRALREIYMPPFEAAVKEAGVWSIMSSYNRINERYASCHDELLNQVLKREWGFDGCVISDWFARCDEGADEFCGLDLEMPGPARVMGKRLLRAVESGQVSDDALNDKVRRLLRLTIRTGRMDSPEQQPEVSDDRPEHRQLARRAAVESMVLIKNDGVLPFAPASLKKLAVIGPNAAVGMIQGGGSSGVKPHYESHPLAALTDRLKPQVEVLHATGGSIARYVPAIDKQQLRPTSGESRPGLTLEFWNGREFEGPSLESRVVGRCRGIWHGRFSDAIDPDDFCVRYSASYTPLDTGVHSFGLVTSGGARLFIDDDLVIDSWAIDESGVAYFGQLLPELRGQRSLDAGVALNLRVEFRTRQSRGLGQPSVRFGVQPPIDHDPIVRAVDTAAEADAVVLVVGSSAEYETEGRDRDDMELPGHQVELIEKVVAANPNTAVVLNCGSPVSLDWLASVPALLQVWFPGQEFGEALADVLLGDVDPSGRLPTTWPVRLEDTPSFATYPGSDGKVEYAEDVMVGYRWYDAHDIAPRAAFGHGLSYTTFEYGTLQLPAVLQGSADLEVSLDITNTGERTGTEVVQLYLGAAGRSRPSAVRELQAFRKIELDPGDTCRVDFRLERRALSHWDPEACAWVAEAGGYEVHVGASSRDIRQRAAFELRPGER